MKKSFIVVLFLSLVLVGAARFDAISIVDITKQINLKLAQWGGIYTTSFLLEVSQGNIEGYSLLTKFGTNSDVDIGGVPESVWDGGGLYTWAPDTGVALEIDGTSDNDTGTVLSSGTATGGSLVTLIDTGATFSSDGVAVGDLVINDSNDQFAIITIVAETTLTHAIINNGSQENFQSTTNASGNTYRIVTADSPGLGAGVIYGTDSDGLDITAVFVTNGTTDVDLPYLWTSTHRMTGIIGGDIFGNDGDIKAQLDGGGLLVAQMTAGNNKTLMAQYRTPADKLCYFLKGYVGITKSGNPSAINTAKFTWRVLPFMSVLSVNGIIELISSGGSYWQYKYEATPAIPPRTFIDIRCDDVSHDDTGVVAGFDLLIKDIGA